MLTSTVDSRAPATHAADIGAFARQSALFLLIGVLIYGACYGAAEALAYRYGHDNRFYVVRAAPPGHFDYVVLGASHAAVFDYRDMNHNLEEMTRARIMNLAVVGGGISINKLLLDYFLTRHRTDAVVYVADSFAFYAPDWNEERLKDRRLFARAPFDPALVALLLRNPATRLVALDYMVGFSKINNTDRFTPDVASDSGPRFERRYRPVPQIDRERLAYLYPQSAIDPGMFRRYLGAFESLIEDAQAHAIRFVIVRPPIPDRFARLIPGEAEFGRALEHLAAARGTEFHDFSHVGNEEAFFQDPDHLNRAGVLHFFETSLAPLLARR